MFNTQSISNQTVNIKPACTGILQKSHPKSFFKWFHIHSEYARSLYEKQNILQVMVFGDGNCLAEVLPMDVYIELVKED